MSRRFVIGVEGLTASEEKKFREYIREHGPWWHWIDNLWLVVTDDVSITAAQISEKLDEIAKGKRRLIFEFPEDIDWSGSGKPNSSGKNMFEWLEKWWAETGEPE
jgi:hypothetical protein